MKKYFLYELKRNSLPILIFSVIAVVFNVFVMLNSKFEVIDMGYDQDGFPLGYVQKAGSPNLWAIALILAVLVILVPVLTFSFKMNKRCVDEFYSLPIRREKLYAAKTLVGLLEIIIPVTLAFWLGFLVVLCKPHGYTNLAGYVPYYFILLGIAVVFFGIHSFLFTRANKEVDGCIFMILYMFLPMLLLQFLLFVVLGADYSANEVWFGFGYGKDDVGFFNPQYGFFYTPLISFTSYYDSVISGGLLTLAPYSYAWLGVWSVLSAACYFGLFFTLKKEKAEQAEQISDSWFGYKVLIPLNIVICSFSLAPALSMSFMGSGLNLILIGILGTIGLIIWRRSFKIPWKYWAVLGGSILFAFLLSILLANIHGMLL